MKIIFDYQIFGTQVYGGISRYFCEIAERISRDQRHKVQILAPIYVNKYIRKIPQNVLGVGIPSISKTGRIIQQINRFVSTRALRILGDVDIYHETYYSWQSIAPKRAARVITVYDMIHEKFRQYFAANDTTAGIKADAIHRADHIICISECTRKDLVEILGVKESKTSVVYLGHTLSNEDADQNYAKMTSRPFILFVGGRKGYKNFQNLLISYANSGSLRQSVDLICFGGGGFDEGERRLIKRLGLDGGSVKYFGDSDEDLRLLYSNAVAYVCPSLYEGFGLPPLEAMHFNCPVVCSNSGSLPEIVGDAAVFFDPLEENDMIKAIENVVGSEKLRKMLIDRGHGQLLKFSWDKCAEETLAVYKNLLGNRKN